MKIPERLKVEAGRYGNSVMIQEIMKDIVNDDYELAGILPNRQGIIVIDSEGKRQILLNSGKSIKVVVSEHVNPVIVPIKENKKRGKKDEME